MRYRRAHSSGKTPHGLRGTVGNISLSGCYVFTFSPLPAGQLVTLAINVNDNEINGGRTVSSHTGVRIGIAFNLDIRRKTPKERLKNFIQHLASPAEEGMNGVFH